MFLYLSSFKLLWGGFFWVKSLHIYIWILKEIYIQLYIYLFLFSLLPRILLSETVLTGFSVRRHVLCGYPTFINAKTDHLIWIRHPSIIKSPIDLPLSGFSSHSCACLELLTIPCRVVKWSFWTSVIPFAFISFVSFPLSIVSMNLCPSNLLRWSVIISQNRYWILHTCVLTH